MLPQQHPCAGLASSQQRFSKVCTVCRILPGAARCGTVSQGLLLLTFTDAAAHSLDAGSSGSSGGGGVAGWVWVLVGLLSALAVATASLAVGWWGARRRWRRRLAEVSAHACCARCAAVLARVLAAAWLGTFCSRAPGPWHVRSELGAFVVATSVMGSPSCICYPMCVPWQLLIARRRGV